MTESASIWVLTGPTAVGKKEVGLEIARRTGAEVIGVDSVKLYRGMIVGGAQPSTAERSEVAVHLVGIADPRDPWNVGRWLEAARTAVGEIRARNRIPLFLGGSPLYLNALLRGFFDGPPSSPERRLRLEREAETMGSPALHARLAAVDPDSADWIGENDVKRIVRALEVFEATGEPISRLQRERTRKVIEGEFRAVGITASDSILRSRQRARVEAMIERGLIAEVATLDRAGSLVGEPARAIGYREIVAHLRGECSEDDAREEVMKNTWTLTRKQRKWFKRLPEIQWIQREATTTTDELVTTAMSIFRSPPQS